MDYAVISQFNLTLLLHLLTIVIKYLTIGGYLAFGLGKLFDLFKGECAFLRFGDKA
jgi:hypothetical protein